MADPLVALIRLGVNADPGVIIGSRKPAVRVLITHHQLHTHTHTATGADAAGVGVGRIGSHPAAITIETVETSICDAGIVPIMFTTTGNASTSAGNNDYSPNDNASHSPPETAAADCPAATDHHRLNATEGGAEAQAQLSPAHSD
jgi:hypothetical protein